MHALIGAVVQGQSRDEALRSAKAHVFEPLVRRGTFDYATTFDEDDVTVSGRARWGEVPPVVPAESEEGRKWIEGRFTNYTEEVERYASRLDDYMTEIDGEYSALWESREGEDAKYVMHQLGRYEGYPVTLYDGSSSGIRSREYLERVLDSEDDVYVALADVHW